MFYKLARFYVGIALRVYYRKIHIAGIENIPKDRPVFLAANHPNGFMEPLLLACLLPRVLHFLVRGDVFDNPFLYPILKATNQIPIYRTKDGFSNLRNNQKSFNAVSEALNKNQAILIFVEGSTKLVRKVRPFQKGMARMIFRTMEKNPETKPVVIPVGLNFLYPKCFRGVVTIEIGKPIETYSMMESYTKDHVKAINALTTQTYESMKEMVIQPDDNEQYEKIAPYMRSVYPIRYLPIVERNRDRLEFEEDVLKIVNDSHISSEMDREGFNTIYGIDVLQVILFPLAVLGFALHIIPIVITWLFVKWVVKSEVFIDAVTMISGLLVTTAYYILCLIIAGMNGGALFFFIIPVLGIFTMWYHARSLKIKAQRIKAKLPVSVLDNLRF